MDIFLRWQSIYNSHVISREYLCSLRLGHCLQVETPPSPHQFIPLGPEPPSPAIATFTGSSLAKISCNECAEAVSGTDLLPWVVKNKPRGDRWCFRPCFYLSGLFGTYV